MKKWLQFFTFSFFSHKTSKEAAHRGYTNLFLGLLLSFAFLWAGLVGGEMLPFRSRYQHAEDFRATVHTALANQVAEHHLTIEVVDGVLRAKKEGEAYEQTLLVSTLANASDRAIYAAYGYDVVVDTRPADTLAEVEAYCISNDGQGMIISYEEYLSLNSVARLNFAFRLRYTGEALVLDAAAVDAYTQYLLGVGGENAAEVEKLQTSLADGTLTQSEYNRLIYQTYFTTYYPSITAYEESSKVPLLRNFYYHEYIKGGKNQYLFIFDDYLTGSFETVGGTCQAFYGFYNGMADGVLLAEAEGEAAQQLAADAFILASYRAMTPITLYAHGMNIFTCIPFLALMPLVVALLAYSILRLRCVDAVKTFGGVVKIVGSYIWASGLISALLTVALSFLVDPSALSALSLVLFFLTLMARSAVFIINEIRIYQKQMEQNAQQTEV